MTCNMGVTAVRTRSTYDFGAGVCQFSKKSMMFHCKRKKEYF